MFLKILKLRNQIFNKKNVSQKYWRPYATSGCINLENKELTSTIKHQIEDYWRPHLEKHHNKNANITSNAPKHYVLSMFPYPSGNLHMGHVRVYTISDSVARFYRMNGKQVLHPMGWDAFGLPAENAAVQHNIPAAEWTQTNILQMKEQFAKLGCSFDWSRELATCDPKYYKWTQWLFLQLFQSGLAYQKEALVNWDPVDKTVLADEQVDSNGCSWRSGAKVEKKLLKQWFIKTTKFAKQLLAGLDDPSLLDWRDIIKLQKHWIGECNGFNFDLKIQYGDDDKASTNARLRVLTLWTDLPEDFERIAFVAITKDHILNKTVNNTQENGLLSNVTLINPFTGNTLPILVISPSSDGDETDIVNNITYPPSCDSYLGVPYRRDCDKNLADQFNLSYNSQTLENTTEISEKILIKAKKLNIGGYPVSSKLKDWLISRQRYWGTPIPIVHCQKCGSVPVKLENLPVELPSNKQPTMPASKTTCPQCGDTNAYRETDTMDTFVDSSWYFLRYLNPNNDKMAFDSNLAKEMMPVDLYIGGKEHAVLHLYYARFVSHFLHRLGMLPQSEPFQRLLVQGMVMGRSYRLKGTGEYLKEKDVRIVNAKKNQAEQITTGQPVVMQWEKMSKSKLNGVEPSDVIGELSCDTVRLIILGDVAPTSHRNWSNATFPGILNWQKRLWLTLNDFNQLRATAEANPSAFILTPEFKQLNEQLLDSRNYFLKETTFNYKYSHQLSVAISKMQGLTNSIRRVPKELIKYSAEYERALATLLIMLAPMAPHFASELWSQFLAAPNRINRGDEESGIQWDLDVLQQKWPIVDSNYCLDLVMKVNGADIGIGKITNNQLLELTEQKAIQISLENQAVREYVGDKKISKCNLVIYPDCEGVISMFLERKEKEANIVEQKM